jgi:hypothetical protein
MSFDKLLHDEEKLSQNISICSGNPQFLISRVERFTDFCSQFHLRGSLAGTAAPRHGVGWWYS